MCTCIVKGKGAHGGTPQGNIFPLLQGCIMTSSVLEGWRGLGPKIQNFLTPLSQVLVLQIYFSHVFYILFVCKDLSM